MDVAEVPQAAPAPTLDIVQESVPVASETQPPKKAQKKDNALMREEGRSHFPVSRVQKILKADKELPIVAREAVFLISVATEEFIKRFSQAAQKQAEKDNRVTIQRKDAATVVRRAEEFFFLDEIIPIEADEPPPRRRAAAHTAEPLKPGEQRIDMFLKTNTTSES